MKKLVIILAMFGLMFNVIGCKAKKALDDTEIIENADVEKIEAEDANFAGIESTLETGPVDESLQAALGEVASEEAITTSPSSDPVTDAAVATTEVVSTEITPPEVAAAPSIDESALTLPDTPAPDIVANNLVDTGITETPVIESSFPPVEEAQTQTDMGLTPETTITGGVSETATPPSETTAMIETMSPPVDASTVISTERAEKFTSDQVVTTSTPAASKNKLLKIADTVPYQYGEGYVNTVYIARSKEKLIDISMAIYGVDKTKELKSINTFVKNRAPRAGEKIYYVSPNRPTDSARTVSFYEDTGMIASTYSSEKGENLVKISKKLLGYDNGWKEIWTTNAIESKTKLAAGETIRYWKGADVAPTPTLASLEGNSKLIDSAEQMPAQVAMNTPPVEPVQPQVAQELPPPPMPDMNAAPTELPPPQAEMAQELPPPPQEMQAPPPPPAEELAAAPMPPPAKESHMEEEPASEEIGMNSDTTTMLGVVAILVSLLGFVLVRRNKKKKEAELASIDHTHVGT